MAAESYFQLRNEAIRILKLQGKPYYIWSEKDKRDVDNFITKRLAKRTDSLSDPYSALYRKSDLDALEREKQIAKMLADDEASNAIHNMWGDFGGGGGKPWLSPDGENIENADSFDTESPQNRVTNPFIEPDSNTPASDTEETPSDGDDENPESDTEDDDTKAEQTKKASSPLAEKLGKGLGDKAEAGGLAEGVGTAVKGAEAIGEVGAIAEEGFVLVEFLPWILGIILVLILASLIFSSVLKGVPGSSGNSGGGVDTVADASRPANVNGQGRGWTLKPGVDYSSTQCAPGSKDLGLYTHPVKNFTVRKCSTKIGIVSSIISQRAVSMINAAKADNIALSGSGFRTYESQVALRRRNCGSGGCNPPTALAGNSQHERGLASDLHSARGGLLTRSDVEYKWLTANAAKFGYYNLPSEPWHWSVSGN